MNIIKVGGSIINPDGKYDSNVIEELILLVQKSKDTSIFVVGGGKLCRRVQDAATPFLKDALGAEVSLASDLIGIAVTKINAQHVMEEFQKKLGKAVYPEILQDPTTKIGSSCNVFFMGGWKPGYSTDKDLMLLAETFGAKNVFKMTNFRMVKHIHPQELQGLSHDEKEKKLMRAKDLPTLTWRELKTLAGTQWTPGLNTPFDPRAVEVGYTLRRKVVLYLGQKEELLKKLQGLPFIGTTVKG